MSIDLDLDLYLGFIVFPRFYPKATLVAERINQKLPSRFDTNEPRDRTPNGI